MNADQQRLFYDDISDAIRACVQALGGSKAVGVKLWPEKAPDAAGRLLSDCLNHAKPEKLGPEQLILVMRWAREIGCHSAMNFFAAECGYEAHAITPEAQRDRLADSISEATRTLSTLIAAAERIRS